MYAKSVIIFLRISNCKVNEKVFTGRKCNVIKISSNIKVTKQETKQPLSFRKKDVEEV
jgi:hypothetical protein